VFLVVHASPMTRDELGELVAGSIAQASPAGSEPPSGGRHGGGDRGVRASGLCRRDHGGDDRDAPAARGHGPGQRPVRSARARRPALDPVRLLLRAAAPPGAGVRRPQGDPGGALRGRAADADRDLAAARADAGIDQGLPVLARRRGPGGQPAETLSVADLLLRLW
jgi:hypothetical protein